MLQATKIYQVPNQIHQPSTPPPSTNFSCASTSHIRKYNTMCSGQKPKGSSLVLTVYTQWNLKLYWCCLLALKSKNLLLDPLLLREWNHQHSNGILVSILHIIMCNKYLMETDAWAWKHNFLKGVNLICHSPDLNLLLAYYCSLQNL